MALLADLLDKYIFSGVPSNAVYDLIKVAWEKANHRSWEDLYLDAFQEALDEIRPRLAAYTESGDVALDRLALSKALHYDLGVAVDALPFSKLSSEELAAELARGMEARSVLIVGGHNLSPDDYAQLTRNLISHAKAHFKEAILTDESAFRRALLDETLTNQKLVQEVQAYLANEFGFALEKLSGIENKIDTQTKLVQQMAVDLGGIKHLAESQSAATPSEIDLDRLALLDELDRASRARCMERWQAAGVARTDAIELAADPSIGAPRPELQLQAEKPLLLLVGELGVGKSLIGERLLQSAIMKARENTEAPVPVYLRARSAAGRLQEAVEAAASGLGNPHVQGATVVIDGADEAGIGPAAEVLAEARILVGTWPRTTTVITSRPTPTLVEAEEAVPVPQLSKEEAYALVSRFAGQPITEGMASGWPVPVRDAIRRPLFAVLLGTHLRDQGRMPRSTGELLADLVERSLGRVKADYASANQLLRRLAVLSTDRGGGSVPSADVASRAEEQQILDSGLAVEHSGAFAFPLPILTQWFAAQSLAAGVPTPDDLMSDPQRLEHWRYSLIIFAGTFSHDQVSKLLIPLAEKYPAFAAEIVNEGLTQWGLVEEVSPPPALECGRRIRTAMQAWVKGIGPLAQLIAPVREDGSLPTIGAQTSGAWLTTAWHRGDKELAEVIEMPASVKFFDQPSSDWTGLRGARPGHQSAWAWRWALDELVSSLSQRLQQRALPVSEDPLALEALWQAALVVTGHGHGSLYPGPIPLAEIEKRLCHLPEDAMITAGSWRLYVGHFKAKVSDLREAGKTELQMPWPGPDRKMSGSMWIWEPYTDKQILARARFVYAGALEGYQQLVDMWFPRLASRMQTAVTLPARLVGVIAPQNQGKSSPTISWYWEALPYGSQSIVDVQIGEIGLDDTYLLSAFDRVRSLRREAVTWIGATLFNGVLRIFGSNPMTELVYTWLWDDLKRIAWV